jgi:hypothetical protein
MFRDERIFGPKRDEVTQGWRKLHNEELHNLYCSPSIIRTIKSKTMRWVCHATRIGAQTNVYRILVRTPEGKPSHKWVLLPQPLAKDTTGGNSISRKEAT